MDRKVISQLNANWVWIPGWVDSPVGDVAGRIVTFRRNVILSSDCKQALIHCSADTRYKLIINGVRVATGPVRSSTVLWYYDALDIQSHLQQGHNVLEFRVLRFFAKSRAAMAFERTPFPGLTVSGSIVTETSSVDLSTLHADWSAQVDKSIQFPTNLVDDVFLHISERVTPIPDEQQPLQLTPYNFKTLNGDLLPWRLHKRLIPLPEESSVQWGSVRNVSGPVSSAQWTELCCDGKPLQIPANASCALDFQADVHSTAFVKWRFRAKTNTVLSLKVVYSEGYEHKPRRYPFFRSKSDRLDSATGTIIGPSDLIKLKIGAQEVIDYEPFWFRTFRIMRVQLDIGDYPVVLESLHATQVNYPLNPRSIFEESTSNESKNVWDVSVRTMRNCMFDGYSDCPFYEQLQYCCDSRSVALFHYLLSGDDRLMRQAIINFAASTTVEGLPQSRFPSYVRQLIAGFPLFWILAVGDHHLYFGDTKFSRKFLPYIDGIFNFFEEHINEQGLVANLPDDVWQYVDWVATWDATDSYPDKGVPTSGRQINLHTWFSLLYAYVLQEASPLLARLGRASIAGEYTARAQSLVRAIREHCFDGEYFTDSLSKSAGPDAYSQHCQVFAVLSGAASPDSAQTLLRGAFTDAKFSRCSYMMKFYAFRAFAIAGGGLYESMWDDMISPYGRMLANNLTTWEEDDVRQRSDCHAWGSVPIFEFCVEIAGVKIDGVEWSKMKFEPRLELAKDGFRAKVAMGAHNTAHVECCVRADMVMVINLRLDHAVHVVSRLPGMILQDHGRVAAVTLQWRCLC